jgi:curli production assembly/transport component CsgF
MYQKSILAVLVLCCPLGQAGELVHNFVNPDFGGSPFNGAPLLANATAQNSFQPKSTGAAGYVAPIPKTAAQNAMASFDNQTLNKVIQLILDNSILGTGTTQLQTGTNNIGNYTVSYDATTKYYTVIETATNVTLIHTSVQTIP